MHFEATQRGASVNPKFRLIQHLGLELLVYLPWWKQEIWHGFTTTKLDFSNAIQRSKTELIEALLSGDPVSPTQKHTDRILSIRTFDDIRTKLKKADPADGLVFATDLGCDGNPIPFGVRTADCLSVLIKGNRLRGVVHAGWRGLANQIVPKALEVVTEVDEASQIEIVVGPCAGPSRYEVGPEVVEAIGESAVTTEPGHAEGSSLLNLPETLAKQIRSKLPKIHSIEWCEICTMTDDRFHSYRRSGTGCGHGFGFLCSTGSL